MHAMLTLLLVLAYLYGFWLLYVLVMGFYRAHLAKRLSRTAFVLAFPILVVAYAVDLFANWTIATVIFLEPPKGPIDLVTDRLSRYIAKDQGWRTHIAEWVCESLLDYFDPTGIHCLPKLS